MKKANYMGLAAAALLGVSAFLPWVTLSFLTFSDTTTGIEGGDGWLVLSLAIMAGLLHGVAPKWAFIPGGLALLLGLYEIYDLYTATDDRAAMENKGLQVELGIGLYLLLLSSLGVIFLSLAQWRKRTGTGRTFT